VSPADRERLDREQGSGALTWYFPDGDLPPAAEGPWEPHESLMILNVCERAANVLIDIYWTDRPPRLGIPVRVEGERVRALRAPWADDADGDVPAITPRTQYAMRVRSDVPVICQYGRLEMVPSFTLYTTMGYTGNDEP
jgi:hypothetical protein